MSATDSDLAGSAVRERPLPGALVREAGQRWLDARFAASTAARTGLDEIEGRSLAIELHGVGLTIVLSVVSGRMLIDVDDGAGADAVLRATPLGLIRLGQSASAGRLRETGAELEGNIHVVETFARTIRLAGPELEAELAGWLGDMLAHEVATTARRGFDWLRRAVDALEQNAAEFLTEEQPLLARSLGVAEFADAVDRLRDDVERAAKRIERLETSAGRRD